MSVSGSSVRGVLSRSPKFVAVRVSVLHAIDIAAGSAVAAVAGFALAVHHQQQSIFHRLCFPNLVAVNMLKQGSSSRLINSSRTNDKGCGHNVQHSEQFGKVMFVWLDSSESWKLSVAGRAWKDAVGRDGLLQFACSHERR